MRRVVVVGAGLAGLTAAYTLMRADPALEVLLLEAAPAAGGQLGGERLEGYLFERGPIGLRGGVPRTMSLLRELGLAVQLRQASPSADRRYVYQDGGLRPLPTSTGVLLRSELLSPPGRLRALAEPMLARPRSREETVHDFLARHFGFEAARVFGDLLVGGLCGGDPRELSLDALFPRLRALEASQGGSLLRAWAAERRAAARQRPGRVAATAAGAPGPDGSGLLGFEDGMAQWVRTLADALGPRLRLQARVVALEAAGSEGARAPALRLDSGERLVCDGLLLALPLPQVVALLQGVVSVAADALGGIRCSSMTTVSLGFDRIDVPRVLDAGGVLLPRASKMRLLEIQWPSAQFGGHAPKGKVLLRALAGGTRDPGFSDLSDEEAVAVARRDLERVMGIVAEPEVQRVERWRGGLPQYTVGHEARLTAARQALAGRWPGTELAGNYLSGLGVHDVVQEAVEAARRVVGVVRV